MTAEKMTRQQEHDFYGQPDNQEPQGPLRRRRPKLTELVPVRFPAETLDEIRRRVLAATLSAHVTAGLAVHGPAGR